MKCPLMQSMSQLSLKYTVFKKKKLSVAVDAVFAIQVTVKDQSIYYTPAGSQPHPLWALPLVKWSCLTQGYASPHPGQPHPRTIALSNGPSQESVFREPKLTHKPKNYPVSTCSSHFPLLFPSSLFIVRAAL